MIPARLSRASKATLLLFPDSYFRAQTGQTDGQKERAERERESGNWDVVVVELVREALSFLKTEIFFFFL